MCDLQSGANAIVSHRKRLGFSAIRDSPLIAGARHRFHARSSAHSQERKQILPVKRRLDRNGEAVQRWHLHCYISGERWAFVPSSSSLSRWRRRARNGILVIAASFIAVIGLRGAPIERSPRLSATISDSVQLARMVMEAVERRG